MMKICYKLVLIHIKLNVRGTRIIDRLKNADNQRYLLYLSISLQILSNSSFVRSPESRYVLVKSFASLVERRDAFAISEARNADAFASSICDAERISFISYLNGASLWVFSMDCFLAEVKKGNLILKEHEAARWLSSSELRQVKWLPADIKVVESIEKYI